MKATGIVRRIDDLGRIVIPKEIRNSLHLKEGNNLEIYVENDKIILEKYNIMNKSNDFAQALTDSIYALLKKDVIITDTDQIIATSGVNGHDNINKPISAAFEIYLNRHEDMLETYPKELQITEEFKVTASYIINTIIVNGDPMGLVIIFSIDQQLTEEEKRIAQIATNFLKKYLEE